MSNLTLFANPAFQEQKSNTSQFNLVTQANTFNAVFNTQPLSEFDATNLDKLIFGNIKADLISEEQADKDLKHLELVTSEIKSIGQQATILIGERIYKAREILKSYKDGTFTKWLEFVLGSKKTGYNILAYYEFYKALPTEHLKESFKKIPQKAAYILASRDGDIQKKINIINSSTNLQSDAIISLVQTELPSKVSKNKKTIDSRIFQSLHELIEKIQINKDCLTEYDREKLLSIKLFIEEILQ